MFVFPPWHIVRMIDIYTDQCSGMKLLTVLVMLSNTDQRQEINMYHTLTASLLSRYKSDTNIGTNNKSVFYGNTRFLPLDTTCTTHENQIINLVSETVEPVLRGHIWDKEKVALKDR